MTFGRCAGVKLELNDSEYPRPLLQLPNPPRVVTTSGPLRASRTVAIVGSRQATKESLDFAHDLAFQLAHAGVVVVSGGAVGIDGAAHRGALAAGGVTWVVSPTGKNHIYPPRHRALFDEVAASDDSRMIWPFPDDHDKTTDSFLYRNGVLAALSETLVVVQARFQSGSRNAAAWARDLGRPVWAMTAAPWMSDFCGSSSEIELDRARPLCSPAQLLRALGLREHVTAPQLTLHDRKSGCASPTARILKDRSKHPDTTSWTAEEILVFSTLCTNSMHKDQISESTCLSVPLAATALLTLALKDVVVENPNGFFSRTTVR